MGEQYQAKVLLLTFFLFDHKCHPLPSSQQIYFPAFQDLLSAAAGFSFLCPPSVSMLPSMGCSSSGAPRCLPSQPDTFPPQDSMGIWQPPTPSALPIIPAHLISAFVGFNQLRASLLILRGLPVVPACVVLIWLNIICRRVQQYANVFHRSLNTCSLFLLSTATAVESSICVCVCKVGLQGVKQTCLQAIQGSLLLCPSWNETFMTPDPLSLPVAF